MLSFLKNQMNDNLNVHGKLFMYINLSLFAICSFVSSWIMALMKFLHRCFMKKVEPTVVESWRKIYILYNTSLDCAIVEYKYMDYKYTYRMCTYPIWGFMGFHVAQQVFRISIKSTTWVPILRLGNLVISDPQFPQQKGAQTFGRCSFRCAKDSGEGCFGLAKDSVKIEQMVA